MREIQQWTSVLASRPAVNGTEVACINCQFYNIVLLPSFMAQHQQHMMINDDDDDDDDNDDK